MANGQSLKDLAGEAMALGIKLLEEQGTPVNAFLMLDGRVAMLDGATDSAEMRELVLQVLRKKRGEVTRYALLLDSRLRDGVNEPVDALTVTAAEAGQGPGIVLYQRYKPKGLMRPMRLLGAIEEGQAENLFEVPDAPAVPPVAPQAPDPLAGLDAATRELYEKLAKDLTLQLYNSLVAPHTPEFAPTKPEEFKALDHRFYNRAGAELLALGFRPMGDFEPLHITRSQARRDWYRLLASTDGTTSAAIVHLKAKRPALLLYWLLRILGKWPKDVRAIELQTEYSDGSFVLTNNVGANPIEFPPSIDIAALPGKAGPAELVEAHRERMRIHEGEKAGRTAVAVTSVTDIAAAEVRQEKLKREYRVSQGGVSDAELRRLTQEHYPYLAPMIRQGLAELAALRF